MHIQIVTFDYGRGEKNPIDCLWFYSKEDEDAKVVPKRFTKDEVCNYVESYSNLS